ncbi:MBL fold metallo-hydrolase [Cesiribacter sp. SM1]|uniref:MBL fold metallo-hydrolase n=1 Tax=Cesiribacter sp. SM1 TaxID=2861196 RepID=UPI001CD6E354|nr:MBL fold metallo-hydrolase [Cesiribacter sp. SM1]
MDVDVLEIPFIFNGKEEAVYPVVLRNGHETILVDCGYAGFLPKIEAAARRHGIFPEAFSGIIITHHDIDHMGGLYELKATYPSLKVYASEIEAKYISGKKKSLRLQQAEDLYPSLPEEHKQGALYFQEMLKALKPVEVDQTFAEGFAPASFRGISIINTPGHMPGHISIYVPALKTLVAADALVVEGGELEIANPHFTLDLPQALASVKKLQQLEVEKIICYHGGVFEGDIHGSLNKLLARYSEV